MTEIMGYVILFILLIFVGIHISVIVREYLEIKSNRQHNENKDLVNKE